MLRTGELAGSDMVNRNTAFFPTYWALFDGVYATLSRMVLRTVT